MKHSPGPWTVKPNYHSDCEYDIYDMNGNYFGDTDPKRMDANARLISAAPDLLEAAKNLVTYIQTEGIGSNKTGTVHFGNKLLSAIAKAEGRSTPMTKREEAEEAAIRG